MNVQEKEPFYIAIARMMAEKLPEPISENEVRDRLAVLGYEVTSEQVYLACSQLAYTHHSGETYSRRMTTDAYFNFLDFVELQEARRSSVQATRYAIAAIVISALSLLAALLIPFLSSTVKIDQEQMNRLEDAMSRSINFGEK